MSALPEPVLQRAKPWTAPISESSPSGEDAKYDDRHVSVRQEVAKLESPAADPVDWDKVVREGTELLQNTSKDLLIASYTCAGLFEQKGLEGLSIGLSLLAGLIDAHWETMFPPVRRMRGRTNAVSWMIERVAPILEAHQPSAADAPAVASLEESIQALSEIARERYEDATPAMRPLTSAVERIKMSLPAGAAPAPTPAPSPEPTPQATEPVEPAPDTSEDTQPTTPAETPAPKAPPSGFDLSRWTAPISESSPSGEDAKYDDRHVSVRQEVAKLESPAADPVDWDKVVREGAELLQNTSKDLLICVYLAMGYYETQGLAGLHLGLAIVNAVCDAHWETMFPPIRRMRGRGNALSWYTERCAEMLEGITPKEVEKSALTGALEEANRLAGFARDKCGEHAPSTRPLLENLQRALMSVPKPKPKEPPPPPKEEPKPAPKPAEPKPAASLGAAPAASLEDAQDVVKYLRTLGTSMIDAATKLRAANSLDPVAYRLIRQGLWLHINAPPPSDNGQSRVPPLAPNLRDRIALMSQNQKWAAVLDEAESALPTFRFCLSLHHRVAQALSQLGAAPARKAVEIEVGALVQRLDGVERLKAADGSPLADDETLEWLEGLKGGEGGGSAPALQPEEDAKEALAAADALVKKGALGEAIQSLEAGARGRSAGRSGFSLRLSAAKLALDAGRPDLGRALHEGLDAVVEAHALERWDPALVAEHLKGYLKCLTKESKAPGGLPPEAGMLYRRLVRLDPVAAARMKF